LFQQELQLKEALEPEDSRVVPVEERSDEGPQSEEPPQLVQVSPEQAARAMQLPPEAQGVAMARQRMTEPDAQLAQKAPVALRAAARASSLAQTWRLQQPPRPPRFPGSVFEQALRGLRRLNLSASFSR